MNDVPFGRTGVQVSALCLGTMMFGDRCDQQEADRILGSALDQGVNFIDTAAMYCEGRTESILGAICRGRRERLFVATKVHKGLDAASVASSIDESLTRLRMDYVDLYLIHWPRQGMQPEPMIAALDRVVRAGKARFVGCCNFPAWLLAHSNAIAERNGWARLVCNQLPYNLIERGVEVEIMPQALAERVAITTYRPLLIGLLAGKYTAGGPTGTARGDTDPRIPAWLAKYGPAIAAFDQQAAARGLHPAQLAIAWLRHSPAVTSVIGGVSRLDQLQPLIDACAVELSDAEYAELSALFDTSVKEEAGGAFPALRRELQLLG